MALKIVQKYIHHDSTMEINISGPTRKAILMNIEENKNVHVKPPSRELFSKAQEEVFRLMNSDLIPKFLKSGEGAAVINLLGAGA